MYKSQIKERYKKFRKVRLCQGDILQNISFRMRLTGSSDEEDKIELPYAVIMSQDCDVELDHKMRDKEKDLLKTFTLASHPDKFRPVHDKFLPTILVCPAYLADNFLAGQHIKDRLMNVSGKTEFEKIQKNTVLNRYHYLHQDSDNGVPELIVDFKHFFTIPIDIIYSQRKKGYLVTITELFRESLSQRFANYLSRFGLPF